MKEPEYRLDGVDLAYSQLPTDVLRKAGTKGWITPPKEWSSIEFRIMYAAIILRERGQ